MQWLIALWHLVVANWEWVTVVLVPFIATAAMRSNWSSNTKGWFAAGVVALYTVVAVVLTGIAFVPENLVPLLMAAYGGYQLSYRAFRSVGITSRWLDRLLEWGSPRVDLMQRLNE